MKHLLFFLLTITILNTYSIKNIQLSWQLPKEYGAFITYLIDSLNNSKNEITIISEIIFHYDLKKTIRKIAKKGIKINIYTSVHQIENMNQWSLYKNINLYILKKDLIKPALSYSIILIDKERLFFISSSLNYHNLSNQLGLVFLTKNSKTPNFIKDIKNISKPYCAIE